ncbi:MAG: IS982 family transposase [Bacteroidota bacterium]
MDFDILYYTVDEFLKNMFRKQNKQAEMNDSEIIFVYILSFQYFSGNYAKTLNFVKQSRLITKVLSPSRFSRRLNRLTNEISEILGFLMEQCKDTEKKEFCIDSFPLAICHLVRMKRCKLLQGKEHLGFNASKEQYFYGFKVHIVASNELGITEFSITPASYHDGIGFKIFNFDLPEGSEVFGDKAYNNYLEEELMRDCAGVKFLPIRKSNSKMWDNLPFINYYRRLKRKVVESVIAKIQGSFPKKIHATNLNGFILKIVGFILSYNFSILFS